MSAPVLPDSFGFNTQPPEGGWLQTYLCRTHSHRFNTQPPEGGWLCRQVACLFRKRVSTHSRLKAAGAVFWQKLL